MLDCSKSFYKVMDSMLNIVYFKIAAKLDSNHKIQLRNEQRSWLTSRNVYFKMTLNKFKQKHPGKSPLGNSSGAQDDAMIMHDENAQFVKERILALLKRTFN
ncbi:lysozyme inhibitor LprI family protein [Lacibacter luteus]|nr:lysozyme inhibitor LprI family protein [Lacibacter luteus]